jgi:hypothetical protein
VLPVLAASLTALAAVSVLLARRVRTLTVDLEALGDRVQDLSSRLGEAERGVSGALARTEAAESVLVEKGLADEEELEAARRRFGDESAADLRDDREIH